MIQPGRRSGLLSITVMECRASVVYSGQTIKKNAKMACVTGKKRNFVLDNHSGVACFFFWDDCRKHQDVACALKKVRQKHS